MSPMPEPASLTGRILPPEEWAEKLVGTPLEGSPLVPEHSLVAVVEDADGVVIAHWAAMTTVHVEGLWIADAHQGHAGTGRALLTTMVEALQGIGVAEVLTQAETPEVVAMIRTVGGRKVPGDTYVIPVKEL